MSPQARPRFRRGRTGGLPTLHSHIGAGRLDVIPLFCVFLGDHTGGVFAYKGVEGGTLLGKAKPFRRLAHQKGSEADHVGAGPQSVPLTRWVAEGPYGQRGG